MLAYYQSSNGSGWLWFIGIAAVIWIVGSIIEFFRSVRENREGFQKYRKEYESEKAAHEASRKKIQDLELHLAHLKPLIELTLDDWKKWGAMLPSLREWADKVRAAYDEVIEGGLINKARPALKSAEEVKKASLRAREAKKEAERLGAQLAIYEAQAPWLAEFTDYSVEEIIEGIQEEEELKVLYQAGEDPVAMFVPRSEWGVLTASERNQKALDRYWNASRRKTAWAAGIQYERFIGYRYEMNGFKVVYQGALEGKEDLGIDLVCSKDSRFQVVQCKRLSEVKGIPVRENVIAQVYGAAAFYAMEHGLEKTPLPVLVTTYQCSDEARKFAKHLGVHLSERIQFTPYPCIKCNVSRATGEKIYHLPFDQQYDKTSIGDSEGDCYARTIAEAESKGFRRAFRWRGA